MVEVTVLEGEKDADGEKDGDELVGVVIAEIRID